MTHCMQPLDVGIFQPYKHWHEVKIQESLGTLEMEYTVRSFLRDLGWIREKTFTKDTIRHAFEKSGMWPVNEAKVIQQMKTFSPPEPPADTSATRKSPKGAAEVDYEWEKYQKKKKKKGKIGKMLDALSSPTRPDMEDLINLSRETFAHPMIAESDINTLKRSHEVQTIQKFLHKWLNIYIYIYMIYVCERSGMGGWQYHSRKKVFNIAERIL